MKLKYILLFPLLAVLVGCGAGKATQGAESRLLEVDKEQVWQLVAMQGKDLSKGGARQKSAEEVLLMFHPESGTVRGRVACNRYFADYKLTNGQSSVEGTCYDFNVDYISGGDVQCPEGDMALQERYLSLLHRADACLLTPYVLTIFQKDKEILRFELK